MTRSALIRGAVMHARTDDHARRTFRYPVYVASIDLAELPALDRALVLFSHGGRNLFALHDADYEGGAGGLAAALGDLLAANRLPAPHTTRLVTNLRVAGYVFNPVSFFLNYDAGGALSSVIAEVNNTYGGRRRYVLGPDQRIDQRIDPQIDPRIDPRIEDPAGPPRAGRTGPVGFRHVRELFVSPFLHGPASYEFWFDTPLDGDRLAITMHVSRPSGPDGAGGAGRPARIFVAELAGTRQPLTDRALAAAAVRYPLMTVQVIGLIHLEAVKLRLRGLPYFRPGPDHRPRPNAPPPARRPSAPAPAGSSQVPATHRSRRLQ